MKHELKTIEEVNDFLNINNLEVILPTGKPLESITDELITKYGELDIYFHYDEFPYGYLEIRDDEYIIWEQPELAYNIRHDNGYLEDMTNGCSEEDLKYDY